MPENVRWCTRDSVTAAALFLATAAFTLWQNTRVAVLWDLSYLLDSAWRFSLGQLPYRDIPFAHAPLTFLMHAAIIKLFGRVYYPHILCAALESGVATVLTWRILCRLPGSSDEGLPWSTILAAPLVFLGIYGVYPHPIYDSDAVLSVLVALYLLQRSGISSSRVLPFLAGAACVLPIFFKQNIGLAFAASAVLYAGTAAIVAVSRKSSVAPQVWMFAGTASAAVLAAAVLQATLGLRSYFYWTVSFAAQRRLPGLSLLLSTYHQQSLPWSAAASAVGLLLLRWPKFSGRRGIRLISYLLFSAPFLLTVISLALSSDPEDRADQFLSLWPHLLIPGAVLAIANLRPSVLRGQRLFPALLPLILLATIHGTFLSQQLWGSTYAIWPLLILLTYGLLSAVPDVARPLAVTVSATLLVCGALYAISLDRLSYIHLDGAVARATLPALRGMSTPGPWIPQFEELVTVTDREIPRSDGVLLIPGEMPFFFATGRTPQFPVLLFDPATDPYTAQQTVEQVRASDIRWLIVTRNLHLNGLPHPDLAEITHTVQTDFILYRTLDDYEIYRRR
jgi:hypothetical protein